jgi:hypothetical protein
MKLHGGADNEIPTERVFRCDLHLPFSAICNCLGPICMLYIHTYIHIITR